jgi:hypothetical protein
MEPVDILVRVNRPYHLIGTNGRGERQLDKDAIDIRVLV